MNVKTGDLVMIVGDHASAGAIGEVGKYFGNKKFRNTLIHDLWHVTFSRPISVKSWDTGETSFTCCALVVDRVLRTISDPDAVEREYDIEVEHVL
jgi:hypothetical protein